MVPFILLLLLACLAVLGLSACADTVDIGRSGGKVSVESDLQISMGHGGGHVTWRISGNTAKEMRQVIDSNYGNNDGTITPSEASSYTQTLDNYLTNSALVYHGGKLQSFSLLDRNRGVEDNTEFLVAKVNDSGTIEIRFLLDATMNSRDSNFDLNDDVFVRAIFDVLSTGYDNNTYRFVGDVEIVHINYIVGMNSFSSFDTDHGTMIRFRGPLWEFYRYSVSYSGGDMGNREDEAQFDTFNFVQSPLELFILVVVVGYLTLYFPKRHARLNRKARVKGLHQGAISLVAVNVVIYFLGIDGIFLWVLVPLFFALIYILSYKIYVKGWKRLAKPLSEAEVTELDRKEGLIRPESYRKLGPIDDDRPRRRPRAKRPPPREKRPRRRPRDRYYEEEDEHYDEERDYEDEEHYDDHPPDEDGYDHDDDRYDDRYDDRRDHRREAPPPRPEPEPEPEPSPPPRRPPPKRRPPVVEDERVHDMEPVPVPVIIKKIRCVQCKEIFKAEIKDRPQKVRCSFCGKEGLIK